MSQNVSKENNLLFSVITPSYNQAPYLTECIQSVLKQTIKPIEHFVFDPGSTDGSREIAKRFREVTLVAEPDEGQSDAINKGFLRVQGDVIAWLNSDDYYPDSEVFEKVAKRFSEADSPDIVYGNGIYIGEEGEYLRDAYINKNESSLDWRLQKEVGILQPALFMKRSVVDKVGLLSPHRHFCMDYEYWIRCHKAGLKFAHIDEQLAVARYHVSNKTFGMRGKSYLDICDMVREQYGYVHHQWLQRFAEYRAEGFDGVLVDVSKCEVSSMKNIEQEYKTLMLAYNSNLDTLNTLKKNASKRGFKETFLEMKKVGIGVGPDTIEIPLDQKQAPGRVCYTVGERRLAFETNWKKEQIAKSHAFFREKIANRKSDTCIVIGNGPSLNKVDFEMFEGQDVIMSNNTFLSPELIKHATYFTVVNYLVAEQSAPHINMLKNVDKVLPYWMGYCLNEDERTYFVDSIGFDEFSTDIFKNISWRHTVTFYNLQLAFGLGYKKVLMTGFDHSYKQEKGIEEGVVIQNTDADENHFNKSYFRGKKWQAADTDNMEHTYELTKAAFEAAGREVVNCTVGGHLEVFRRSTLEEELGIGKKHYDLSFDYSPSAIKLPTMEKVSDVSDFDSEVKRRTYPKVLIIDMTLLGNKTATGEIKKNLFADWPKENLAQIHQHSKAELGWMHANKNTPISNKDGLDAIKKFKPDVILYRPVPDTENLHAFAMELIRGSNIPLISWIVDDWPKRLSKENPSAFASLDQDIRELFNRSFKCLSIGKAMSKAFSQRYGVTFGELVNGINQDDWPLKRTRKSKDILIRYAGGLAKDMTLDTVRKVAKVTQQLSTKHKVHFEIRTQKHWLNQAESHFKTYWRTHLITDQLDDAAYRQWLMDADIVLIGYNFDEASQDYVGLSIANKMPECLASGAALLAIGPKSNATIEYLKSTKAAIVVSEDNEVAISDAIEKLACDDAHRREIGDAGRRLAFGRHKISDMREVLLNVMGDAKSSKIGQSKILKESTSLVSYKKPPVYAEWGERLRLASPGVFSLLRLIRRVGVRILKRPVLLIPLFGVVALIGFLLLQADLTDWAFYGLIAAVFGVLFSIIAALAMWSFKHISTLSAEINSANKRIDAERGKSSDKIIELSEKLKIQQEIIVTREKELGALVSQINGELLGQASGVTEFSKKVQDCVLGMIADQNLANSEIRAQVSELNDVAESESFNKIQTQLDEFDQSILRVFSGIKQLEEQTSKEISALRNESVTETRKLLEDKSSEFDQSVLNLRDELTRLLDKTNKAIHDSSNDVLEEARGLIEGKLSEVDSLGSKIGVIQEETAQIENRLLEEFEKNKSELSTNLSSSLGQIEGKVSAVNGTLNSTIKRLTSNEQIVGKLRYPNAPSCLVFFGHHKCGSHFFRTKVFERFAELTSARIRKYKIEYPPFHYSRSEDLDLCNMDFTNLGVDRKDVVLFSNATERSLAKIQKNTEDWKGLRILRDPRQVLVSSYFHHKGNHADANEPAGWVWDQLKKDKVILRELPEEEGLLHELNNISKDVIENEVLADLNDDRILTVKLEDYQVNPREHLDRIAEFLEIPTISGINMAPTNINPDQPNWRSYFTSSLRQAFKERYGKALIDLGYAEDMDW